MQSSRPSAAAAVRASRASCTPCAPFLVVPAWSVRGVRFASRCGGTQAAPAAPKQHPKQFPSGTQA
eukprot:10639508-Lingulodinium_polyedra.AAC.1